MAAAAELAAVLVFRTLAGADFFVPLTAPWPPSDASPSLTHAQDYRGIVHRIERRLDHELPVDVLALRSEPQRLDLHRALLVESFVPRTLVRDDLNNGTLVAPLGFAQGPNKLAIWVAPHLSRRPDTVGLVDWLTDELRSIER